MYLAKLRHRIYYTDLAAVSIGLMAAAGSLVIIVGRAGGRRYSYWVLLTVLLLAVGAFSASSRAGSTRRGSWYIAGSATVVFVSMMLVFWRWPIVWGVAATLVCSVVLLIGVIKATQPIATPLTTSDLSKLVSLAVSLGLTVTAAEIAIRMAPGLFREEIQQALRADPRNYGVAHPYIGHLHRPNAAIIVSGSDFKAVHKVDALGFRNEWPWPEHADMVVLGDSVAFGYGVAEHEGWSAGLSRAFPGRRLINLALIGGGPQQYLRVYETFGAPLEPKLVIVGLWPLNDFANARTFDEWLRSGVGGNYMVFRDFGQPRAVPFDVRDLSRSLDNYFYWKVYPVLKKSHLFNLIGVVGQTLKRTRGAPPRIMEFADGSHVELIPGDLVRRSAQARADRPEFRLLLDSLKRLHETTAERGARTLVLLQPGKEEVYLPLLSEPVPDQTAELRAAFEKLGIEYLDLTPAFRKRAAQGERLFFESDSHPNPAGHDVIAEVVVAHVLQNHERYGF